MKKAKDFLESAKRDLVYWQNGLAEILNGTFKYDDSLPKSCVYALYKSKVATYKEVIDYLKSLDENIIISTNIGATKEGLIYYDLVNGL